MKATSSKKIWLMRKQKNVQRDGQSPRKGTQYTPDQVASMVDELTSKFEIKCQKIGMFQGEGG